jgi:RNA-directed DNA polymerase
MRSRSRKPAKYPLQQQAAISDILRVISNSPGTIRHWALHQRSDKTLDDLARMFNTHSRWINYYGRYYKSALYPTLRHIDRILARWARRKFKSLRRDKRRTHHRFESVVRRQPDLFVHWIMDAAEQWAGAAGAPR